MQRFFVANLDLAPGAELLLPRELAHQLGRVLRSRPGDHIILLDGSGDESVVELRDFKGSEISGVVLERRATRSEPARHLTLYQCLLKGDKFDLVLQKGTELGAGAFVPVLSERVIRQGEQEVTAAKKERWTRIIREAAEQSGRGRLPGLLPLEGWAAALAEARASNALLLVPWEGAQQAKTINDELSFIPDDGPVALFIGPEGGLSEAEARTAQAEGAKLVTLGPRILRAETAAIAAITLALLRR